MFYKQTIEQDVEKGIPKTEIARKIFLSYPTFAFVEDPDLEFKIKNEISLFLKIPITNIHFAGSAKIGYSIIKGTVFKPKESDLDIAIIDKDLFLYYSELSFKITKGFSIQTRFKDQEAYSFYIKNLSKGIFRPDLMPRCPYRQDWWKFFNQLSNKHIEVFKKISAGIYQSECFFESKQGGIF